MADTRPHSVCDLINLLDLNLNSYWGISTHQNIRHLPICCFIFAPRLAERVVLCKRWWLAVNLGLGVNGGQFRIMANICVRWIPGLSNSSWKGRTNWSLVCLQRPCLRRSVDYDFFSQMPKNIVIDSKHTIPTTTNTKTVSNAISRWQHTAHTQPNTESYIWGASFL